MTLLEFLTALSTDAEKYAAFQDNPEKTMEEAGISPEEQELLKSNDEQRIREYLHEKSGVPLTASIKLNGYGFYPNK